MHIFSIFSLTLSFMFALRLCVFNIFFFCLHCIGFDKYRFFFLENALKKKYWILSEISFFYLKYNAYIIGHYNPSVRIINIVSHTSYIVCVNFIHKWQDLHFKVDSEQQIFLRNFSWQICLFTLRVFASNLLRRKSPKKYFFRIWRLAWD